MNKKSLVKKLYSDLGNEYTYEEIGNFVDLFLDNIVEALYSGDIVYFKKLGRLSVVNHGWESLEFQHKRWFDRIIDRKIKGRCKQVYFKSSANLKRALKRLR